MSWYSVNDYRRVAGTVPHDFDQRVMTVSRRIGEAITVTMSSNGKVPAFFSWRGKTYRVVKLHDCWREVGAWWEGEHPVDVFEVIDSNNSLFELLRDQLTGDWLLNRIVE